MQSFDFFSTQMTRIYQDLRRKIPLQFIEGVPEGRGSKKSM
jgi:hypothetical protein